MDERVFGDAVAPAKLSIHELIEDYLEHYKEHVADMVLSGECCEADAAAALNQVYETLNETLLRYTSVVPRSDMVVAASFLTEDVSNVARWYGVEDGVVEGIFGSAEVESLKDEFVSDVFDFVDAEVRDISPYADIDPDYPSFSCPDAFAGMFPERPNAERAIARK